MKLYQLTLILSILLNNCHGDTNPKINLRRKTQEKTCGESLDEYPLKELSSIGPDIVGKKVMVSHTLTNSDKSACTRKACTDDDPCCNICGSAPKFDHVHLIQSSADMKLGCYGTNCDVMDKCTYKDGDQVLVYGTVDGYGLTIIVDEHCIDPFHIPDDAEFGLKEDEVVVDSCKELSDEYMIPGTIWCEMYLGVGVWNGECTHIAGCSANGNTFFESMEECESACFDKEEEPVVEIEDVEEGCKELNEEYMIPGTIYCTQMLGIGVWNGECKYISGCSANGNVFFDSFEECESKCFPKDVEYVEPVITISPPAKNATSYLPYEGIRACIQNTLQKNIYLPGCSVFTLQGQNITYTQRQCIWTGMAVTLPPGEEYCSDYELFFREVGEYTVSTRYCTELSKDDTPVLETDCLDSSSIESEEMDVECPDLVNCMPFVDDGLVMVCGFRRDDFIDECPNTMLLD